MLFSVTVTPASEILTGVVAEVIKKAPLTPEKVALAWRLAVGPAVAKATTVSLDGLGVLHVKAATPGGSRPSGSPRRSFITVSTTCSVAISSRRSCISQSR